MHLAKEFKLTFTIGLVLVILLYYLYKGKYKRVLEKCEQYERVHGIGLHPVLVFIIYYGLSFVVMLLAGLYKNGHWIFAR